MPFCATVHFLSACANFVVLSILFIATLWFIFFSAFIGHFFLLHWHFSALLTHHVLSILVFVRIPIALITDSDSLPFLCTSVYEHWHSFILDKLSESKLVADVQSKCFINRLRQHSCKCVRYVCCVTTTSLVIHTGHGQSVLHAILISAARFAHCLLGLPP